MMESPEKEAKKARHMMFRIGFKKGVGGSAHTDAEKANADWFRGHVEGRDAAAKASKKFCADIGHDPLTEVLR